jgi:hypothetical protein
MKALTVWQPWASFLASGEKEYETRGYSIQYRGLLVIHAAARPPREGEFIYPYRNGPDFSKKFPLSALLGIVEVIESLPVKGLVISNKERSLGDYSPGRFAWRMRVVKKFEEPIPYKGAQGLWNLPLSVLPTTEATS